MPGPAEGWLGNFQLEHQGCAQYLIARKVMQAIANLRRKTQLLQLAMGVQPYPACCIAGYLLQQVTFHAVVCNICMQSTAMFSQSNKYSL